jgi:hypothetical protein
MMVAGLMASASVAWLWRKKLGSTRLVDVPETAAITPITVPAAASA